MSKSLLVILGVIVIGAVVLTVARTRQWDRVAKQAAAPYGTPRNYIQHSDWAFEVEIAALPSFVPISFRAPTTTPTATTPVRVEEWAVPVGTKIVLRDEEDRRVVLALRRVPAELAAAPEREIVDRVMEEVVREVGMWTTDEVGDRRLGEGMGWQFSYEAGRHLGTMTIGVRGEQAVVVICAVPDEGRFRSARRTFERTLETVKLK